jgi:integrase
VRYGPDNCIFTRSGKRIRAKHNRPGNEPGQSRPGGKIVRKTFGCPVHTFNTYMRKSGVPESVIMEITGHSTREMFDRYNTIDHEDRRQAVDQMSTFLRSVDQSVDQEPKNQ